ncbi:MAG TPA: histidine kinase [Arachidicoccus sp.]
MKSLVRLSWLLSATISAIVFIYLITYYGNSKPVFLFTFFSFIILLCTGYINIYLISLAFRKLDNTKSKQSKRHIKWIYYLYSYLSCIVIYVVLGRLVAYLAGLPWIREPLAQWVIHLLINTIVENTLILTIQSFIIVLNEKTRADIENAQLKTANMEAENLLLRQQIHPHLLFNALNTLKSLYKKDIHAGETYLIHLADFLRVAVSDFQHKIARLSDEIKLCSDYLGMQKIRFGSALNCTINIPEDILHNGFAPSFSVQPLIENAIKHNEVTEDAPLNINIFYKDDYIVVTNNLQLKNYKEHSTGNGLANLIERYKMISGNDVIVRSDSSVFSVSIKVLSNEDNYHRG